MLKTTLIRTPLNMKIIVVVTLRSVAFLQDIQGNQFNCFLRIWGSWLGVGNTDVEVIKRNLTQIVKIARASARAIKAQ